MGVSARQILLTREPRSNGSLTPQSRLLKEYIRIPNFHPPIAGAAVYLGVVGDTPLVDLEFIGRRDAFRSPEERQ